MSTRYNMTMAWFPYYANVQSTALISPSKNIPPNLLHPLQLQIPPHANPHHRKGQHPQSHNQHPFLRYPIRRNNCVSLGRPNRILQDLGKRAIQLRCFIFPIRREIPFEVFGHSGRPNRSGDGCTDSAPDLRSQADESEGYGDGFVVAGGETGDLVADNEGSPGDGFQDLACDDVADVAGGRAEGNHEPRAEEHEGHCC